MTLRHYAFSRQYGTQFSEDVFAFVLWRYVAVQIWRVKELFVPGIVTRTINKNKNNSMEGTAESVKGQRAVAPLTLIDNNNNN